MNREEHTCQNCNTRFTIEPEDFKFYEKIQVPPPTWCPGCRMQRRFLWRNERILFRRTCDATGKEIFSMFPPGAPVKVYDRDYWWSDAWDATEYGKDYDFSKPFFVQLRELMYDVPWFSRSVNEPMVNSQYCMNAGSLRDCYLIFDSNFSESCFYGVAIYGLKDSVDCFDCEGCELCYECIRCNKCYRTLFSVDCEHSHDVAFSKNLRGCSHCFGCVNLRNK